MGSGISAEQAANHLARQEALINQLQTMVELQAKMLEGSGSADNTTVDPQQEQPHHARREVTASAIPEDEIGGLERRARQSEHRKKTIVAIEEDEANAPSIEWTEPTEEDERNFMATKPWLGAMAPPTGFVFGTTDAAPSKSLVLHHVYGLRSTGVRNNVIIVDANTLLYFAAGVGIVHDIATNTQRFFLGHRDDVVCIAYDAARRLVATGEQGRVPAIYLWQLDTCQQVAKIAGFHRRAVVSVSFSSDGRSVASVGLDDEHSVAVFQSDSGNQIASGVAGPERIVTLKFVTTADTDGNSRLVTVGVHHIAFWTVEGAALVKTNAEIVTRGGTMQAFLCVDFTPQYTVVGTQSGELYFFKATQLVKIIDAHNENVFAIKTVPPRVGDAYTSILSAGQDGVLIMWNATSFSKENMINLNKQENAEVLKNGTVAIRSVDCTSRDDVVCATITGCIYRLAPSRMELTCVHTAHYGDLSAPQCYGELWGLAAVNSQLVATAAEDSTFRLWDFHQRREVLRLHLPYRAQCIAANPAGTLIAVGLQNGAVALFTVDGQLVSSSIKGKRRVQCLRFSPSGRLLASGTADNWVDLFDISANGDAMAYKGRLKGHSSVVLKIDFSKDEKYLQTCSQAYELIFYDLGTMSQVTASRSLRDVSYATFTSILGWDVQGIWPAESDGSDVNSVCRSNSGKLLATAEDTGLVKLFQYPCVGGGLDSTGRLVRRPESVFGTGHSEHITEVRWSPDDQFLFSTGGGDLSIFQWRVV